MTDGEVAYGVGSHLRSVVDADWCGSRDLEVCLRLSRQGCLHRQASKRASRSTSNCKDVGASSKPCGGSVVDESHAEFKPCAFGRHDFEWGGLSFTDFCSRSSPTTSHTPPILGHWSFTEAQFGSRKPLELSASTPRRSITVPKLLQHCQHVQPTTSPDCPRYVANNHIELRSLPI